MDELLLGIVKRTSSCAVIVLDGGGRIQEWYPGAAGIFGWSESEASGQSATILYPPEAARQCASDLRRSANGQTTLEGWRSRKNGELFWVRGSIEGVTQGDGTLAHVLLLFDVTGGASSLLESSGSPAAQAASRQEALRQSDQRFEILVRGVKEYAIFMLDPQGTILTWNSGAQRIKGYSADEVIGKHFSIFYPSPDVASGKCERELEVAQVHGKFEEEGWRIKKDGSRFWANVVITALQGPGGELLGFAKVTRDLTERLRQEQEKLRLAQAEEAIRLRDEFLSIASHELKTPLSALLIQLYMVEKQVRRFDANLANKLLAASRSGTRLADLIEALLDVSRISTGRVSLSFETFDLCTTVHEIMERSLDSATNAGCTLVWHPSEPVVGTWDRLRIEQVLINLVSNGIKYAFGKPIEISIKATESTVCLVVRDHGPGIDPADQARIFERFERGKSLHQCSGMGVGLFIAREIATAHGGALIVDNHPEGGAIFTVQLPRTACHISNVV